MTNNDGFDCGDVEERASEYIDHELAPNEHERVRDHLEQCEICQDLVDDLLLLKRSASLLSSSPIPTAVGERLRARLRAEVGFASSEPTGAELTLLSPKRGD